MSDSSQIEPKFDSDGVLRHPDFHDGYLEGITVLKDRIAKFLMRDLNGQRYELVLSDVERLRADEFCEGNIIFDVVVIGSESWDDDTFKKLYHLDDSREANDFLERV